MKYNHLSINQNHSQNVFMLSKCNQYIDKNVTIHLFFYNETFVIPTSKNNPTVHILQIPIDYIEQNVS